MTSRPAEEPARMSTTDTTPIGYMVVEPSLIPSGPPAADWDGEIHLTRGQADAECAAANSSGSEPHEPPDDRWRVVAVVEVDAISEAEKRGAARAFRAYADQLQADGLLTLTSAPFALRVHADRVESGEKPLGGRA